jgi:dipeptidyl aminopeptidase/acylaminoacyl peptidase
MYLRTLLAIVVATALILSALPASAAETTIPISAFVRSSKYSHPRLSPNGKYLAVSVTQELEGRDQKTLNVYDLDGFKLLSTMRFPVFQIPLGFEWVSNTRLIVPKAEEHGDLEQPVFLGEIFATDFDGKNQEYLYGKDKFSYQRRGATSGGDDKGWGYVHSIPSIPNGHFFLREYKWEGSRASSDRSFLYDVDATTGARKLVADVGARDLQYLLQHDGKPRFAFGSDDKLEQIAFLRDADRDEWKPLPAATLGTRFRPIAFTPDNKDFYLLLSEKGGPNTLMRQSMSTGERTLVGSNAEGSIDIVQYSVVGGQPFAVASNIGVPRIMYVDESSPDAQLHKDLSKQFPGQHVRFASASTDGSKLLFTVSSDREPGEYYLLDRNTKKADFLVAVRPLIDASKMAARNPIRFKARDGLELHGYLTAPANRGAAKLPLILHPHGGPQGVADNWFFDTDSQFLASRGYAVLQVNYRGSGGRGTRYFDAGNGQWATGMQQDLIDGVKWAVAEGIVDPARVCVYGASFGAYAAMMTSIQEPDMFKCAVGYAGLYDLPMLLTGDRAKESKRTFNFWTKAVGNNPELLRKDSPTYLADKIKVPVLLVHGDQDTTTPPAQAEAMRSALTKAGKSFEWMMVPKEGHGFYAEKNRIAFYEKLEAFFAKHLGR